MTLSSRYDPKTHEAEVYRTWLDADAFRPAERSDKEAFTIAIPPPNVTGVLHMGHALNGTFQDVVIRFQRMCGKDALWIPGTDHAGIATQAVVEKRDPTPKEKKTREELGREEFVRAHLGRGRKNTATSILEQYRRLGASCDWSRTRFTLEPAHVARRARGLRAPVGASDLDLPRRAPRQLGLRAADGRLRRRGRDGAA